MTTNIKMILVTAAATQNQSMNFYLSVTDSTLQTISLRIQRQQKASP